MDDKEQMTFTIEQIHYLIDGVIDIVQEKDINTIATTVSKQHINVDSELQELMQITSEIGVESGCNMLCKSIKQRLNTVFELIATGEYEWVNTNKFAFVKKDVVDNDK